MSLIRTVIPDLFALKSKGWQSANALAITPEQSLEDAYNWLKSSDRDGDMGALSATNRRTLLLMPGKYTVSGLTLDTDYVDLVNPSGNPADVCITRGTGGATVTQTCNCICLFGLTIENTGSSEGDHGFVINAMDNANSRYYFLRFCQDNASTVVYPVYGLSDLGGEWCFVEAGDFSFRVAADKKFKATMFYVTCGRCSIAGDAPGASMEGATLRFVSAGDFSFGGCAAAGVPIKEDCLLEFCSAGNKSYAMGSEFAGTARFCTGGKHCFAGYAGSGMNYGTFCGLAEYCTTDGGNSFGMGNSNCVLSGQIRHCRNGTMDDWATGQTRAAATTLTDNSAEATLTTNLPGDNNDLTYTARMKGRYGNTISVEYWTREIPPSTTVTVENETEIRVGFPSGNPPTAAQVKSAIEAYQQANDLVSVAYADGNDGTGTVTAMAQTYLSGGIDPPLFEFSHPAGAIATTSDRTVYSVDNGATYTNTGATGPVVFTLPPARKHLRYTFVKTVQQDITITRGGTDTIDGGTSVANTTAETGKQITLACFEDGKWITLHKTGTWA